MRHTFAEISRLGRVRKKTRYPSQHSLTVNPSSFVDSNDPLIFTYKTACWQSKKAWSWRGNEPWPCLALSALRSGNWWGREQREKIIMGLRPFGARTRDWPLLGRAFGSYPWLLGYKAGKNGVVWARQSAFAFPFQILINPESWFPAKPQKLNPHWKITVVRLERNRKNVIFDTQKIIQ